MVSADIIYHVSGAISIAIILKGVLVEKKMLMSFRIFIVAGSLLVKPCDVGVRSGG